MFGGYRTILALAVALFHLVSLPYIGMYAVHCFFILSGFLMTAIMHETYGYGPRGFGSFAANRLLRLWPLNAAVVLLTVLAIYVVGEDVARNYQSGMFWPDSVVRWIKNFTIIYPSVIPAKHHPILVPPTWALTVELFYYLLIGLGISHSRHIIWALFAASVVIVLALIAISGAHRNFTTALIYYHIASASLPFSVGSLLFHYRRAFPTFTLGGVSSAGHRTVAPHRFPGPRRRHSVLRQA